jgi:general secretion pathway protein G
MSGNRKHRRAGFTLIEVLIVVVILGILAATVLPQFTSATDDAKESALLQNLQTLRVQIQLYQFQHDGQWPAQNEQSEQAFRNAMTMASNMAGEVAAPGTPGFPYGPYVIGDLPANPYNRLNTVQVVTGDVVNAAVDGSTGWIYSATTGQIKANFDGTTVDGTPIDRL